MYSKTSDSPYPEMAGRERDTVILGKMVHAQGAMIEKLEATLGPVLRKEPTVKELNPAECTERASSLREELSAIRADISRNTDRIERILSLIDLP